MSCLCTLFSCCLDQCKKRTTTVIICILVLVIIALVIAVIILNIKIEHGGASMKKILLSKAVKQLLKRKKHG